MAALFIWTARVAAIVPNQFLPSQPRNPQDAGSELARLISRHSNLPPINYISDKPVYLQIVEQIKYAAAGNLNAGESVPGIRPLVEKLRVNRNTAAKTYQELEREGVIETLAGKGRFVSDNHSPLKKSYRQQVLNEAIDAALVQAHHFRINDAELLELVQKRIQKFREDNAK